MCSAPIWKVQLRPKRKDEGNEKPKESHPKYDVSKDKKPKTLFEMVVEIAREIRKGVTVSTIRENRVGCNQIRNVIT
jgi:hypothetical protein